MVLPQRTAIGVKRQSTKKYAPDRRRACFSVSCFFTLWAPGSAEPFSFAYNVLCIY